MKCSIRKDIIKTKRALNNDRQKMTYASIAQASVTPQIPKPIWPQVTKEEILKINICVVHAQQKDQQKPGTYAKVLNKMLLENKLPSIIIPDDDDTAQQPPAAAALIPEVTPGTSKMAQDISRQSSSEDLSAKSKAKTGNKLNSQDLGLEFYTLKQRG